MDIFEKIAQEARRKVVIVDESEDDIAQEIIEVVFSFLIIIGITIILTALLFGGLW